MAVFDLCENKFPTTFSNIGDKKKILIWIGVGVVCLIVFIVIIVVATQSGSEDSAKGRQALVNAPLVDGHNNLASNLRRILKNNLTDLDFEHLEGSVLQNCSHCKTDLSRLKDGKISTQFWSVNAVCSRQHKDAVAETLEQIDVIKRLVRKYPKIMTVVTTAQGIMDSFNDKKIGSLLGIEGGHSIDARAGVLRTFYDLGVRYMTLTWKCNTPWADSNMDSSSPVHNLTEFGKRIVKEMNRLGMIIDLSHATDTVVFQVLEMSKAPVIFSHSAARSIYNTVSNVNDEMLQKLKDNGGIVMVNFNPKYLAENVTAINISTVITHINHIAKVAGVDHIGIGANYDGTERTPKGLEDVSKYPYLFDLLQVNNSDTWTIENLEKLAGRNLIRVFKKVEQVKENMTEELLMQEWISEKDLTSENVEPCRNKLDVSEDAPDIPNNIETTTVDTTTEYIPEISIKLTNDNITTTEETARITSADESSSSSN